jgi:hypothetical protein
MTYLGQEFGSQVATLIPERSDAKQRPAVFLVACFIFCTLDTKDICEDDAMSNPKLTVDSKWAADLQIGIYLPWESLTEIEKDNLTSVLLAGAPHLRNSPENRCVDAGTGRHNYQAREQKRMERLKVLPHSHHNNSVISW